MYDGWVQKPVAKARERRRHDGRKSSSIANQIKLQGKHVRIRPALLGLWARAFARAFARTFTFEYVVIRMYNIMYFIECINIFMRWWCWLHWCCSCCSCC